MIDRQEHVAKKSGGKDEIKKLVEFLENLHQELLDLDKRREELNIINNAVLEEEKLGTVFQ